MRARAVSVVVIVLAVAAGCGGDDDVIAPVSTTTVPPTATSTVVDGVLVVDTAAREQARLEILGGPDWLATDDAYVYVRRDNGGVDRIDPDTNEVVASVDVAGGQCQGLGAGEGSVWSCTGTGIVRLDFDDESVGEPIEISKSYAQGTLPVTDGRVWVLTGDGSELVGVDVDSGEPDEPIELGIRGTDLAAEDGGAWVVSGPDNAAVHVDLNSRAVVRRIDGLPEPTTVDIEEGVWIGGEQSTVRVEPADGTLTTLVPTGPGSSGAIAVSGPDLWVRRAEVILERVDAADGAVRERLVEDGLHGGGDVVVAFGSVWTTAYDDATLLRLALGP